MIVDQFGGRHATESEGAVKSFESAVACIAAHRTGALEALDEALRQDARLVAAYALRGFACVILARTETVDLGSDALVMARRALTSRSDATDTERVLVDALADACGGRLLAAADCLDRHIERHPHDFLAVKLAHSLRFMAGDRRGMLDGTRRVVAVWTPDRPGAGFLLGCHAFALEEHGLTDAAERVGREAVAIEPGDAWGLHAVAHVHETQMRLDDGVAWLEAARPHWTGCNNFRFHLAWHLALFLHEQGRDEEVLSLYDRDIRPTPTDDVRDVANATSLLWRLAQVGLPVGDRWDELAALARRRRDDTTLVFASLHHLLALVAAGDRESAFAMVEGLAVKCDGGDQSSVAREVGAPLGRAILGLGARAGGALVGLARDLPRLGGSNAQRDVFLRTLANAALSQGDSAGFAAIQALRPRLRAEDRFARMAAARRAALAVARAA